MAKQVKKEVCSFEELRASYSILLKEITDEKDQLEQNKNIVINGLEQKLIKFEEKYKKLMNTKNIGSEPFEVIESVQIIDPKLQEIYVQTIDDLTNKNRHLTLNLESYKKVSINETKSNENTKEQIEAIKDMMKKNEVLTKQLEEANNTIKKLNNEIQKLKNEMENNKILTILKEDKNKLEVDYQMLLEKNKELEKQNYDMITLNEKYSNDIKAIDNAKESYRNDLLKTLNEIKLLKQALIDSQEKYEKEIQELNKDLSVITDIKSAKEKMFNILSEITYEYLILKYTSAYSVSIFDMLSSSVFKTDILKGFMNEKANDSHNYLTLFFSQLLTFLKINLSSTTAIDDLLSKFSFITNTNEKKDFGLKVLDKYKEIEGFSIDCIQKDYNKFKKSIVSTAGLSVEKIRNSCLKDPRQKEHNIKNKEMIDLLMKCIIIINNETALIYAQDLVKCDKNDISSYLHYEMKNIKDITITGDLSSFYIYLILLNCIQITTLRLNAFDITKSLNSTLFLLESVPQLIILSITNCNLHNEDIMERISLAIKQNHSIKHIILSNNKICNDGLFKLADCLITQNTIITINLSNNLIDDVDSFFSVLTNDHTIITSLDISGNPLNDQDISNISQFLTNNNQLKYFNLSKTTISLQSANNLRAAIGKNSTLEQLVLNDIIFNPDNITLLNTAQPNTGLKLLHMDNSELDDTCIMLFCNGIDKFKSLEILTLKNTKVTDMGLSILLDMITRIDNLKEVDLQGNDITEDLVIQLSTGAWMNKEYPKVCLSLSKIPSKFIDAVKGLKCVIVSD